MSDKDYYDVLGVDKDASKDEISKAYRKKAMKYHPDRNPDDEKAIRKFKEATEAYEVLSDEEKKRQYDQVGSAGQDFGGPRFRRGGFDINDALNIFMRDFGGFGGGGSGVGGDIFSGFGGGMGGGPGRRRVAAKGQDIEYSMTIPLRKAYEGGEVRITVPRTKQCSECGGTGARGGEVKTCPACGGSGKSKSAPSRQGGQVFVNITTCGKCGGSGRLASAPCSKCAGKGRYKDRTKMTVKIPKGIRSGNRLRLKGKGEAGRGGGPSGDLYLKVNVREDGGFEREGTDLFRKVKIPFYDAILGKEIQVRTMDGRAKVKVPPGSQPGTKLRLKGKGMPRMGRRGTGDLYVELDVGLPRRLTEEQRALVEKMKEQLG